MARAKVALGMGLLCPALLTFYVCAGAGDAAALMPEGFVSR